MIRHKKHFRGSYYHYIDMMMLTLCIETMRKAVKQRINFKPQLICTVSQKHIMSSK